MGNMTDWVDDEAMSREETHARFAALNPEPARGPRSVPSSALGVIIQSSTFPAGVTVGVSVQAEAGLQVQQAPISIAYRRPLLSVATRSS